MTSRDNRPGDAARSQLNQRKGAKVQRRKDFWLPGSITYRVIHINLSLPCHLPVPCAFASGRFCVNCRFYDE